nr:putative GTP-binding protein 6 isoform X2 [Mirounga angustirostris]
MWALRAAVRPGTWLSRVVLGRGAPRAALPLPACLHRALAAFGPGGLKGRGGGGRGPRADGPRSRAGEEEEPEDAEEEEAEEEELLRRDPLLPVGTQRVCLIHPEVKRGPGKPQLTRAEWQVAEAEALVHTLGGWSVADRMVVPSKTPDGKLIFGRGTLENLTEKIRGSPDITAVFLNVERLATPTKDLEAAWGVQVLDRFTVVLHIFRCNARTREARLQVALAELPLLRSQLKSSIAHPDGRGGGSRYIMGSGESFMQLQQRLLKEKEIKIRKALERLRKKRRLLGKQRRRQEFPVISVVGYTNCGESTSGREK